MDDVGLGRTLRALRLRAGLNQRQASERAGISQATWSRIERGHIRQITIETLSRVFAVVEARLEVSATWRGGAIDRLRDERHSALVAAVVEVLEACGWATTIEVTFSEFGERGSVDVLAAWQERFALVVEVKSELTSVEETLRKLDLKTRLAGKIISDRYGWRPEHVARLLALDATMTNRRRVASLAPILDRALPARSDEARRWLRTPSGRVSALLFVTASHHRTHRDTASHRDAAQLPDFGLSESPGD